MMHRLSADASPLICFIGATAAWFTFKHCHKKRKGHKLVSFLKALTGATITTAAVIYLTNSDKYSQWIDDFIEAQLESHQDQ